MTRPRLLDLFCGAGGAAMGYHRAGFDQADALQVLGGWHPLEVLTEPSLFDAIHASPPCQAYSVLRRANPGADYPDLIGPLRELLRRIGLPWVIENVPGAPLRDPVVLCGSMFGLGAGQRQLRRHRLFEASFVIEQPECHHEGEAIGVYGGGAVGRYTFENGCKVRHGRRGGYQGTIAERREAMGIDWMNGREINQAIPPAYTEFIGAQLLAQIRTVAR